MADTDTPPYGLTMTTERNLTPEEVAGAQWLARRYRWRLLYYGLGVLLGFAALVATLTNLMPYEYNGPTGVFIAALVGSMTALGVCTLGLSESFQRQRALTRDAAAGVLLCYEGPLKWSDYLTPTQRTLLRRGLLRPDGTAAQALEALPASGLVLSVNDAPLARPHFDPELVAAHRAVPSPSASTECDGRSRGGRTGLARLLAWIGFLLMSLFLASLAVATLPMPGPPALRLALGALIVYTAFLAHIAVHEGGHLLAGWSMRMRFVWCRIGPVVLWRTVDGLRWSWTGLRHYDTGFAQMVVEDERRYRWREGWMIVGGPLASLLLTGAMLALWSASGMGRIWPEGESVFGVMAFLGVANLAESVIPRTDGKTGTRNDFALLWRLLREPDGARHEAAQSVLWARMMRGERPRDWDEGLLDRAAVDPWGAPQPWGGLMRFYHALDAGRLDDAEAGLERGLQEGSEPMFRVEAAFFHALFRRDAETARAHLDAIPDEAWDEEDPDHLRAEAAVLRIEGDGKARDAAERALAALRNEMTTGLITTREGWLHRILEEDATPHEHGPS